MKKICPVCCHTMTHKSKIYRSHSLNFNYVCLDCGEKV